ncbi:MAG: ABC transporter permease subunit [Rhodospirillales bacterium]|jgi:general L-amino acid transport system permease protein|nr:ABC transporter permease subunit [Rhodospirillales bacterium]
MNDIAPPRTNPFAADKILSAATQFLVVAAVLTGGYMLFVTTQGNLEARHIESGFTFLGHEAGFPIGDSLISFEASDSYGRAFVVGVINTFYVSVLSIIGATVVGVIMGVAQVSHNWLIAKLAEIYVEIMRNIPLLLTLLFVYGVVLAGLPSVRRSFEMFTGGYLNQRGLYLPRPLPLDGFGFVLAAALIALIGAVALIIWARRHHDRTGVAVPSVRIGFAMIIGLPVLTYFVVGAPLDWELPALKGFNFKGGLVFRPEFAALLLGLVVYRGAFIAENVRSGIQAVGKGQREAAAAVGLAPGRTMQLVVLPQALRTIIPSTTNDYASLVKDSSLAVAIGYPDMVSVGGTMIGQNGQAIEVIGMWMAIYLAINLVVSLLMNWANLKAQLVER